MSKAGVSIKSLFTDAQIELFDKILANTPESKALFMALLPKDKLLIVEYKRAKTAEEKLQKAQENLAKLEAKEEELHAQGRGMLNQYSSQFAPAITDVKLTRKSNLKIA